MEFIHEMPYKWFHYKMAYKFIHEMDPLKRDKGWKIFLVKYWKDINIEIII